MIKTIKTRRSLIQACCTMCLFIFLKELYSLQHVDLSTDNPDDKELKFPFIEDVKFSPKPNSIYFHVTSLQGYLRPSEACAVEAAARAHPAREVYVLFTSPIVDYLKRNMRITSRKLRKFRNIKLLRIHLAEYSNGTIVESLLLNDLKYSSYPERHTADILKILTLNKWGGMAVETNMIILKPFTRLPPNWILKENEIYVAPGIMQFSKNEFGLNVTSGILKEMSETYKPDNVDITGRIALEKVVQRICPVMMRWDSCKDIIIYPADEFYSIDNVLWTSSHKVSLSQVSFSFHLDTLTNSVDPLTTADILDIYCPSIYMEYQENLLN